MSATLDAVSRQAADTAMRAAATYIKTHNLQVDVDELIVNLRREVKDALPGALRDAGEAHQARMGNLVATTFLASMALAGIAAAKQTGGAK